MQGGSFCGVEVGKRVMQDQNEFCHQRALAEPSTRKTNCCYAFSCCIAQHEAFRLRLCSVVGDTNLCCAECRRQLEES